MDIHQLEHFLAVVDEGTFTRAAGKMCRTQPAVSQSIKKLEDELGTALFERDTHDLTLTDAGKHLVGYARRMIQLRDEAVRSVGELRELSAGTLAIASHETAALYLLPGPLRKYAQQFPEVRVGVSRSPLDEIPRRVLDREVDLGFVTEDPGTPDLASLQMYSDELVLIASPGHPLITRKVVRIGDLGSEHFVIHHLCATSVRRILQVFDQHHTPFRVVAELWSFENIKDFVEQDIGLAIVPRVTVLQELRTGLLVEVPVAGLQIPRRTLLLFRDRYVSDAARGLLNIVSTFDWSRWHAEKTVGIGAESRALRTG
ncbi:MAG: LysR family transcriptional regulator [Acidobacteria bacterium]|nr:LysR family transcriptional regulator [Acidobacteriota bacterium]